MKQKKKVFVTLVLLVVIVAGSWLVTKAITNFTGYSVNNPENINEFAKCLTEKNAELYVNAGCPHCAEQKAMFGDSLKYLKIIDCVDNPDLCLEKEIRYVPTWIINENKEVGKKSFEELAELSGCKLNKEPINNSK